MSISGFLEEASVAEVMQFIHFGRRTGTLFVTCRQERASIGFDSGRIVSAHRRGAKRLGEYLLERQAISGEDLLTALRQQAVEIPRRHIGRILVDNEAVAVEVIEQVVARQIEETIRELVSWSTGTFDFLPDNLNSLDAAAARSSDLAVLVNLSTEAVALKALHYLDEESRDGLSSAGAASDRDGDSIALIDGDCSLLSELRIASKDPDLGSKLGEALRDCARIVCIDPHDLEATTKPGLVVMVDLRSGQGNVEDIRAFRQAGCRAPVIAITEPSAAVYDAYDAGAQAVLSADVPVLVACYRSVGGLLGLLPDAGERYTLSRRDTYRPSGPLTGPMVVDLMSIVAESADRAVLFLVAADELSMVGSFGFGVGSRPLAELTSNLRLPLADHNVLTEAVKTGVSQSFSFGAGVPHQLASCLGPPRSGHSVVVAITGQAGVFAVLYADNGHSLDPIENVEALDFAGEQLGIAVEQELSRAKRTAAANEEHGIQSPAAIDAVEVRSDRRQTG